MEELKSLPEKKLYSLCDVFKNAIPELFKRKVIYFDQPLHSNIGDHLILWGAIEYLRRNHNQILDYFSVADYSKKKVEKILSKHPDAVLVMHGGGNFGDLYSIHQNFRLKILSDFSTKLTYVFSQSVYYKDSKRAAKDLANFAKPNVLVLVRDKESFDLLCSFKVNTKLVPDCAHWLIHNKKFTSKKLTKARSKKADEQTLLFRRKDSESTKKLGSGFDWGSLIGIQERLLIKLSRFLLGRKTELLRKFGKHIYFIYSHRITNKAIDCFCSYSKIDTDRLHGALLSLLLGLEVVMHDNNNKKLTRYSATWLR